MQDHDLAHMLHNCALRDHQALQALYQRVSPFLLSIARRIVRCDALANEVIQDSFIQIWDKAEIYHASKGSPLAWMSTIARNRAIDKLKVEAKHRKHLDVDGEEDCTADSLRPEDHIVEGEIKERLYHALSQLKEREAVAMRLAYLHDYSRKELAESMGVNVNTVKSWLHRGAKNMRRHLMGDADILNVEIYS